MENVQELLQLMARLRDPLHGCPWDLRQDFKSLAPYCLEEAHEVVDAIERGDSDHLREELGDLLLQVVFLARIAEEQGLFDFAAVVETLKAKLTRRHPHVFGERRFASEAAFKAFWEDTKTEEQKARHPGGEKGLLDGIARTLPALSRAQKIQSKAARVGFDWPSVAPVYAKLEEELEELRDAAGHGNRDHTEEEMGDVLFVIANLARHYGLDAETALRKGNDKFLRRFADLETQVAASGRRFEDHSLDELDLYWAKAKDHESQTAKET